MVECLKEFSYNDSYLDDIRLKFVEKDFFSCCVDLGQRLKKIEELKMKDAYVYRHDFHNTYEYLEVDGAFRIYVLDSEYDEYSVDYYFEMNDDFSELNNFILSERPLRYIKESGKNVFTKYTIDAEVVTSFGVSFNYTRKPYISRALEAHLRSNLALEKQLKAEYCVFNVLDSKGTGVSYVQFAGVLMLSLGRFRILYDAINKKILCIYYFCIVNLSTDEYFCSDSISKLKEIDVESDIDLGLIFDTCIYMNDLFVDKCKNAQQALKRVSIENIKYKVAGKRIPIREEVLRVD